MYTCHVGVRMRFRTLFRNVFGFTRSQSNGFIILLPLLLLFIFSEPLYRRFSVNPPPVHQYITDSLVSVWGSNLQDKGNLPAEAAVVHVIPENIDPNLSTREELVQLGIPPPVAGRIIAYRKKGGKFAYRSDLLRIYGFDSALYLRLQHAINLPEKTVDRRKSAILQKVKADINLADSADFLPIRGIGPVLAGRIVRFRQALGGFVHLDQLYRVYGLDSAVVSRIHQHFFVDPGFMPRQLNINTATEGELAAHPLVSRQMAKAIITYRLQHGRYSSTEELNHIITLREEDLRIIKPYLRVD